MLQERDEVKARNDRESAQIDSIFEDRKRREAEIKVLQQEIANQSNQAETLVAQMPADRRAYYLDMKATSESLSAVRALQFFIRPARTQQIDNVHHILHSLGFIAL